MKLVLLLIVLIILYIHLKKSMFNRTNQLLKNYEPDDCNYGVKEIVYPSGNVPGSYLGLSRQEKEMLLPDFIKEKNDPFNEEGN